jgi:hypothetical protein
MDKYIVLKLISSEEIVATQIGESDYHIKVLFPMLVKTVPKLVEGRIMESITLAPYTYFAADDELTFNKSQIIFIKDLSENHYNNYKLAVDDFVGNSFFDTPQTVDDLKDALNKLAETFSDKIDYVNLDNDTDEDTDAIFIDDQNKSIH